MKKKIKNTEVNSPGMETGIEDIKSPVSEEGGKEPPTSERKEDSGKLKSENPDDGITEARDQSPADATEDIINDAKLAAVDKDVSQEESTPEEKDAQETNPAPGIITDAPQHPEHLNMSLLGQSPILRSTYILVSDDKGQILGLEKLEAERETCQKKFEDFQKGILNETGDDLLEQFKQFSLRYAKRLNMSFAISDGLQTKSRIRLGMHFLNMKKLVRKSGKDWTEWFSQNFDEKHLRSIQDFMQLAKVPNIIRYSVFGKGRLLEVVRGIGKKTFRPDEDPIADFLSRHHLNFDPESEETLDSWRIDVDTAIAMDKIQAVAQEEQVNLRPDRDLVKKMVGMGIPVNAKLISDLVLIEENHGDINRYLDVHFINDGALDQTNEGRLLENSKMVESISKVVSRFKDTVKFFRQNPDLSTRIDYQKLDDLESEIRDLRALRSRS